MANGSFDGDNQMHSDKTSDATPRHDRAELQQGIATTSRDPEFCEGSTDDTLRTYQGDNEVNIGNVCAPRERRPFCRNFLRDRWSRGASCPHLPSEYTTYIGPGYDWCVKLHQEILATSENTGENARNPEIAKSDPTRLSKTSLTSSMDTNASLLNKEANAETDIDCRQEEGEKGGQALKTLKKRKRRPKCNGTQLDMSSSGGVDSTTAVLFMNAAEANNVENVSTTMNSSQNPHSAKSDPTSPSKTNLMSSMDTNASLLNKEANAETDIDCRQEEGEKDGQVLKTSKRRKRHSDCNGTQLDMCSSGGLDSTATILYKNAAEANNVENVLTTSNSSQNLHSSAKSDPISSSKTNLISSMDTNASVLNIGADAEMDIDFTQEEGEKDGQVLKTSRKKKQRSKCGGTQLDVCSSGSLDSTTTALDKNATEANKVENVLTTSNSSQNPYSSSEKSVLRSKRKLLVLDINGILADIVDTRSNNNRVPMLSGKAVYIRRFCHYFINFCFERFDVGIWSSRLRKNVDRVVDILMGKRKRRLLFCWNQYHCTRTGYKTLENKKKPLVLKELKKLWAKHRPEVPWDKGYYDETNTVLLDDSPYKALSNPPYTAIFPHSFTVDKLRYDGSLGPDGDIRQYLERLADAKDVQEFIRENPFGQLPITDQTLRWNDFYSNIASGKPKPKREGNEVSVQQGTSTSEEGLKTKIKKEKKGKKASLRPTRKKHQ